MSYCWNTCVNQNCSHEIIVSPSSICGSAYDELCFILLIDTRVGPLYSTFLPSFFKQPAITKRISLCSGANKEIVVWKIVNPSGTFALSSCKMLFYFLVLTTFQAQYSHASLYLFGICLLL